MRSKNTHLNLLGLWLFFLIVHIGIVCYLLLIDWIGKESFIEALEILSGAYSPYIGAMLLFFWTKKRQEESVIEKKLEQAASVGYKVLIITSILWNLMISFFLIPLVFGIAFIEEQLEILSTVSDVFAWLVAGAFGHFFAKN